MILSEAQKNGFNDKGFIVMKSFYNEEDMNAVSVWLDKLQDMIPFKGGEAKYYEKSTQNDENILVRIEHILGYHNPVISKLLLSQKATDCLMDLFDEPALLFKDKVNYKLPGCRADKLHQDQAAGWNAYGDFYISMGIVIDENRMDNAALSFMKSGNYKKELMGDEWKPLTDG